MTPVRWKQIEELFHRAAECGAAERAQLLNEVGDADANLRYQLESLLSCLGSANAHLNAIFRENSGLPGRPTIPYVDADVLLTHASEVTGMSPGTVVGPYRLLDQTARGGMGLVYRGVHVDTGEFVAIKTALPATDTLLDSIRREIDALSRIRHPGIVRILEQGIEQGRPWYAMEFLRGKRMRDLMQPLSGQGRDLHSPDFQNLLTLLRGLCISLSFLHGEGIVHCDLKPDNIVITGNNDPVIIDFGLAKQFEGRLTLALQQASLDVSGTASYMSPDMLRGEVVDARADLYALGCILYEVFAGKPPFAGDLASIVNAHLFQSPPDLPTHTPEWPPELNRVIRHLLAKDPADRLGYAMDVAAVLASLGARESYFGSAPKSRSYVYRPRFRGRPELIREVSTRLSGLSRGAHSPLTVISGESGIGKTRFLSEIAREANKLGLEVLMGECTPDDRQPLGPLRRVLQFIAARCCRMGIAETERVVGEHGKVFAVYEPSFNDLPGQDRYVSPPEVFGNERSIRVFQCFTEMLVRLAEERPLVLLLDDLQWADALTAGLIHFVKASRKFREAPIAILISLRTEEMPAWAHDLTGTESVELISLARLPEDAVGEMAGDMLAVRPAPIDLGSYLYRQSEGNPFFVAEYLRMATETGILHRDGGVWRLPLIGDHLTPTTYDSARIPESLQELIQLRLRNLSHSATSLLFAAAVLGRESEARTLAKIDSQAEPPDHLRALNELLRRQILEEVLPGLFRFSHDKVREVTYENLAPERRKQLHASAAIAIEQALLESAGDKSPERIEEKAALLAHHYSRAEKSEEAVRYFRLAGDCATRASADAEAISHYGSALEIAEKSPTFAASKALRVDLRLELYIPRMHLYSAADDDLLRICREAEPIAKQLGDARRLVQLFRSFSSCFFGRAQYTQCIDYGERCLEVAKSMEDPPTVCTAAYTLAIHYLEAGRFRSVQELVRPFSVWLGQAGPKQLFDQPYLPYVTLAGSLGVVCTMSGDFEESDEWHQRSVQVASEANHRYSLALAHVLWGWSCYTRGDGISCSKHGEATLEISMKAKLSGPRMMGLYNSGIGAVLEGRTAEGMALLNEGLHLADRLGYAALRTEAYYGLARGHLAGGDLESAENVSQRGLEFAYRTGELKLEPEFHRFLGHVAFRKGKRHRACAVKHFETAAALYASRGLAWPATYPQPAAALR